MNTALINILLVGAGSCLGGVARYIVSRAIQSMCHGTFPWGTFMVNVVGCFIIGLVYGFIDKGCHLSDGVRLFVTVGFCGGFTTFSTFMHENYLLFTGSQHLTVALYALTSAAAGFLMVYLAYHLVRGMA
ncbi:MAG: fluoride efflux transporter CrcB [Bacteroides sp.]|nr:fluoride efflux transporter CrcB [Bacteroides sp.]